MEYIKEVYLVYGIQTIGCLFSKGSDEGNDLGPMFVVLSKEEAEHAVKINQRDGLLSFYTILDVRSWSRYQIKKMKRNWREQDIIDGG